MVIDDTELGYRVYESKASQFLPPNTKNFDFANDDLAKSGLTLADIRGNASPMLFYPDGATAAYQIPYFDLQGKPLINEEGYLAMYRTKFRFPIGVKGPKYLGPKTETLAQSGLPSSIPYVPPIIHGMSSKELICAEGEKKTASIIKLLQLPAFGIGGCQMWRDPDQSGRPHPWILELLRSRNVEYVLIVPDGDIQRYDISAAYGTFARALQRERIKVEILHPPGKIDDLLVSWGDERTRNWTGLPKINDAGLVQSTKSLLGTYNLAFKTDGKGISTVHQHTSNIMTLMTEHPAFPKVWLNQDNNTVMIGEEKSVPNKTDMDVANYFQYNLGFDKVHDRLIHNCVLSLARTNARSPFHDWICAQTWDRTPRLDNWLTEYWGCDSNDFIKEVGAKWLISACARIDKPGTKLDWIFITIGPQGTGKTTMPEMFFGKNYQPLYGESNDKDFHMLLHSHLCVGFDELDSFGKKESSMLKAMITRSEDAFRPPYGSTVEVFPRRCTLYGCGNRHDFLQYDPSGYRRYAIVEVNQLLDFERLGKDRGQLWAEAWQRYQAGGVKYWEVEGASLEAEKYAVPNILEDKIINWVETEKFKKQSVHIKDGMFWFTMTDICSFFDLNSKSPASTRDIAAILHKMGLKQTGVVLGPGSPRKQRWYRVALDS